MIALTFTCGSRRGSPLAVVVLVHPGSLRLVLLSTTVIVILGLSLADKALIAKKTKDRTSWGKNGKRDVLWFLCGKHFMRLLALIRNWYVVPTVITAIGSLYYGPRKALETWEWYCEKYDAKVAGALAKKRQIMSADNPPLYRTLPQTVDTISAQVNRSPQSVEKSLRRLEHRSKAIYVGNGWEGR